MNRPTPPAPFPLLGTLATAVVAVVALAVSMQLRHPEMLEAIATDGGALLARCVATLASDS